MTIGVKVDGGTNAGWRKVIVADIAKCQCGGFISCGRAKAGATRCLRCENANA